MRLIVLMLIAVAFAGCAESSEGPSVGTEGDLSDGKGGILGLLIDDIYRPIAGAEVLLQPVGLIATADENGEFGFRDLEPGAYVLRVSSEKHEAIPFKVEVFADEYSEAEVSARRLVDNDGALITYEYAVFVDCALSLVVALPFECSTDLSGDSSRREFEADYTEYPDVSYLVTEMLANNPGRFEVDMWWPGETLDDESYFYANDVFSGEYIKMVLTYNETNTENEAIFTNDPWDNQFPIQTEVLLFGEGSEELGSIDDFFLGGGVGVHLAVKAKFMHSLFLGEPQEDITTYCVYCT